MCTIGGGFQGPRHFSWCCHGRILSHYCHSANPTDWLESSLCFVLLLHPDTCLETYGICAASADSPSKVIVCILNPAGMRKKEEQGTLLLHWGTEMYSHAIVVVWKWCFINAVVSKPVLRCRPEPVNPFHCLLLCCLRYLVYCNLSKASYASLKFFATLLGRRFILAIFTWILVVVPSGVELINIYIYEWKGALRLWEGKWWLSSQLIVFSHRW